MSHPAPGGDYCHDEFLSWLEERHYKPEDVMQDNDGSYIIHVDEAGKKTLEYLPERFEQLI